MKRKLFITLSALWLAASATGQALHFGTNEAGKSDGQALDEIALVVNEEAISRRALNAELAEERALLPKNINLPEDQLLERVIINHLLNQLQSKSGISVSDAELDAAIARISQQNRLSTDALYRQVQRTSGLSRGRYREQIRREIALDKLKEAMLSGKIHITEAQINDQIAQIARQQGSTLHVQDMLLPVPSGSPEARAKIIHEQIKTVANELRRQNQNLERAAANIPAARFRDMGEINIATIDPRFARVLANTESGKMAEGPVVDHNGMHFLKVVNKVGSGGYQVDEGNVSHILLRTRSGRDAETQRKRINEIYRELQKRGVEAFPQLARKYSEDPKSATKGGNLGWVSPEDMASEFAQAMQKQDLETLYPPFKTAYGYHLLLVHDRKRTDKSEDLLRQRIKNALYGKAVEDAWQQQLRALRQESYVDIR